MVPCRAPSFRNGSLFPIQPTLKFIHRDRRFPATRCDEIPESRTCSRRCRPHSEATDGLESVVVLRGLILVAIAHGADEPLVPGRMFAPGEDVERSDEALGRSRPEQVGSRRTSPDVGTQQFPEQFGKVLMLHGTGFENRHIVLVPNQCGVLTGFPIENAPSEGADLVRRGLRGSNATDSRNLGMFPPRFGDERPQGPVLWFKHRTSKRHFELERGPKSRRDGGTRRITHVTTEEATLVPWLNALVGKRPVIAGANRLDDRASVAPASGSADAGLGKEDLEVEIFGEATDETVPLGEAGAAGEDGSQVALPNAGDGSDQPDGVPVLLHERRIDSEIGGDRLDQLTIGKHVRRRRTCRRSRSSERNAP